jgi:hypothetical protein
MELLIDEGALQCAPARLYACFVLRHFYGLDHKVQLYLSRDKIPDHCCAFSFSVHLFYLYHEFSGIGFILRIRRDQTHGFLYIFRVPAFV